MGKAKKYTVRRISDRKLNIDNFAGFAAFFLLLAYVVMFSFLQTEGFVWTSFQLYYLSILLPIWLVDGLKVFLESFTRRSYRSSAEDLSKVTVVIACKDGEDVIGATLRSLLQRFVPNQIIVASNGSTDHTCMIAQSYGVELLNIKQPLGKVRAINRALNHVKTPYVLLLDDDTLVGNARIPTGLLDEGFEGVAFRVLVKKSNWVSQVQLYEYRKSTDIGKRYHNNRASVQNISGAIGLFSLKELKRQIRKHSGEFSGEDLQRTLLIHLAQDARGVVLTDSTVYTQPPDTVNGLFRQRVFGWFPGLFANFRNYIKVMTRDRMPVALRFDAFYNVFLVMLLDVVRLLSLPILILYPWYFITMYLLYVFFESIGYFRMQASDPYWVVLIYPFYGLFGFITRYCAFAVFAYRRLTVLFGKRRFLDDYRSVSYPLKVCASLVGCLLIATALLLNAKYFFVEPILNIGIN